MLLLKYIGSPLTPAPSADIAIIAASLPFLLVFLLSASKDRKEFFSAYFIHRGPRTAASIFSTEYHNIYLVYLLYNYNTLPVSKLHLLIHPLKSCLITQVDPATVLSRTYY